MRILIVSMMTSVHTARWISQFDGKDWDIHVFPIADDAVVHKDVENVTIHQCLGDELKIRDGGRMRVEGPNIPNIYLNVVYRRWIRQNRPCYRQRKLASLISSLKPDLIHSMDTLTGGKMVAESREFATAEFPSWIHSVWGSDLFFFGRFDEHRPVIGSVMKNCDFCLCERERDKKLARSFGFKGEFLSSVPGGGGYDVEECRKLCRPGNVSERPGVLLKGYHGWAGRGLVGLRALERCADVLKDREIIVYSAPKHVRDATCFFADRTGLSVEIMESGSSHREILEAHGRSRIHLGLSMSDGLPNSLLESIVMGSFPIQSNTAKTKGWIEDGKNCLLVHPEEPGEIEKAVRNALVDDELVNGAAETNRRVAVEELDKERIKDIVFDNYRKAAERGKDDR